MIIPIKGGFREILKKITKIWMWSKSGYMDEQGNPKKNNKDHSKVIKDTAKPKVSKN